MEEKITLLLFLITLPLSKGAQPGAFFWKPRLALALAIPTTEVALVNPPTKENIRDMKVVMIDGYAVGITIIALAVGISSGTTKLAHLNPTSGYFYTNAYRWALRYMSLLPNWLGGHGGNYVETHRTWKRRFYYMDAFIPSWMKKFLPFVKKAEWEKEEMEFKRYNKYAEPAFGKHYGYPNDGKNRKSEETVENLDTSSGSLL